jgi:hypothetical protein
LGQTKEKKLDLGGVGPYKKEKKKVHAFHILLEYINGFGIN